MNGSLGHHPKLLRGYFAFESRVAKWNELDRTLKYLGELAAVATIGCS